MLILAAILFGFALVLWFIDNWMDSAAVDLSLPARILVFVSGALIGLNFYVQTL